MHLGNTYGSTKNCRNEKLAVKWLMADERTRREELDAGRYRTRQEGPPSRQFNTLRKLATSTSIHRLYRHRRKIQNSRLHSRHNRTCSAQQVLALLPNLTYYKLI